MTKEEKKYLIQDNIQFYLVIGMIVLIIISILSNLLGIV